MKFYVPYQAPYPEKQTKQKEQIERFIQYLLDHGFPEENLNRQESGIEIDTNNTVLRVEDVPEVILHGGKKICYGSVNLIQTECLSVVRNQDKPVTVGLVTVYDTSNTDLPKTLCLSEEEIQEEQNLADEIALQEKPYVPKTVSEISDFFGYFRSNVKRHLTPIIKRALQAKGYSDNALESKLGRVLNYAYQKFDLFAMQEKAQIEQKWLQSLTPFSHAHTLLTKDNQHQAHPQILALVNILTRLNKGEASLNPYWMGSGKKRDKIALAVIDTMRAKGIEGVKNALVDKNSTLYQAINQKRITRLTLFGKHIEASITECHSAQRINNLQKS